MKAKETKTRKGFIESPKDKYGNNRLINLDATSNIAFEEGLDYQGNPKYKIIFNFGYGITLKKSDKQIPDYAYIVLDNYDEYQKFVQKLNKQLNESDWVAPIINNRVDRLVNPDFISFISTDKDKNRIIVNLTCSVSFYNDFNRKTSDFIFFDFEDKETFENELRYMKDALGLKI